MKSFEIYKKDTKMLEKTYHLFQLLNLITCCILGLASIVLSIYFFSEEGEIGLIPLGAFIVVALTYVIIRFSLNVKFGMYYDIRSRRMNTENSNSNNIINSDELPDL